MGWTPSAPVKPSRYDAGHRHRREMPCSRPGLAGAYVTEVMDRSDVWEAFEKMLTVTPADWNYDPRWRLVPRRVR
jgi:hypothetical protein